jgi:hypothetical protein
MPIRVIFRCEYCEAVPRHRASDPPGRPVLDPEMGAPVNDAPDLLLRPVYASDGYKPFGQFTLADVSNRASELAAASGFGPTAKVASVARAWSELARAMRAAGAATVSELGESVANEHARQVWVVPPGGSLL